MSIYAIPFSCVWIIILIDPVIVCAVWEDNNQNNGMDCKMLCYVWMVRSDRLQQGPPASWSPQNTTESDDHGAGQGATSKGRGVLV